MKQVSRQWHEKLSTALFSHGFHQAPSDSSLFIKHCGSRIIILLVYVDDVLIVGDAHEEVVIKGFLDREFGIKDLVIARYFPCFEVFPWLLNIVVQALSFC